jgi:hypothetical protein
MLLHCVEIIKTFRKMEVTGSCLSGYGQSWSRLVFSSPKSWLNIVEETLQREFLWVKRNVQFENVPSLGRAPGCQQVLVEEIAR